ncbi:MAG: hypothetical protein K8S56_09500, partial [Candidatus Cloacimonetes bacterium]|nr:hypothetical protein [Candidatus Cloacimonadota bacterium]
CLNQCFSESPVIPQCRKREAIAFASYSYNPERVGYNSYPINSVGLAALRKYWNFDSPAYNDFAQFIEKILTCYEKYE